MSQLRGSTGEAIGHVEVSHTYTIGLTHAQAMDTLRAYRVAAEHARGNYQGRLVDLYNHMVAEVYGPQPTVTLIRDSDGNIMYNDGG